MHSVSAIHGESIYRDTARKEETRLGTERAYIYISQILPRPWKQEASFLYDMGSQVTPYIFYQLFLSRLWGASSVLHLSSTTSCFQMILLFDGNCIISSELWV